ncbi:MAG: hypothetical protein WDM76_19030 [Limisphaerales bacterium]
MHRWLEEVGFKKSKSASSPPKNNRRISRRFWRARKNKFRVNIKQPKNAKVIAHLTCAGSYFSINSHDSPAFAPWDSVPNPYSGCGCHPDIVEYLWDKIGKTLPADCGSLVYGNPALVQPKSGIILAIGSGTSYRLRLPGLLGIEAVKKGAKTQMKWSTGDFTDIQKEYGEDWVFGAFLPEELVWCKQVYEMFDYAT